ncbi:hypothetical protein [Actinophytocola sp.]|uniref:hypothetical protein n=1 Tax=Actinophytocola sp. TaxID=1872138 RepID=UPI00389987B5
MWQRIVGVFRRRRVRDSASFGAASLGVLLLVGAALGTGVARTAVDVSDGLTWLPDNPRGEVVQVNPASGRPEVRLRVAGGDAQLDVTQKDGLLVILNRRNGQITVMDLATLLASGRRQAQPGPATTVLVSHGRIYVVDRPGGTIADADPVTLADLGAPWRAGKPLADVVADDAGVVWAADYDGRLHSLDWVGEAGKFREKASELVQGAGPGTVLVPHAKGVTLFGLDDGVVRQVGTGSDVSGSTPKLPGEVLAARSSPDALVPAAVPGRHTVVIVAGERVVRVDTAALGCPEPGRPVVFRDEVYVPCRGQGKVVVLDKAGRRGGSDVRTPGSGDPEIVLDDGRLVISAPGAERGVIVDADGATHSVTIRSPSLPVVNPDRPPLPEVPSPPRPTPRPERPDNRGGDQRRSPDSPGPGIPGGTSTPGGTVPGTPPGVTVALASRSASEIVVTVSWGAADDNGEKVTGYTVEATGDFGGGTRTAQTTSTSTRLTIPCDGGTFCVNGRLDVTVTALNRVGASAAGTRSWTVPAGNQPTSEPPPPVTDPPADPPPQDPPPANNPTTDPPADPPADPPPAATVPTAGATVITSITATGNGYTRRVTMTWPGDWAGHDGTCQVVNTTLGYGAAITCGTTTLDIDVDTGPNRVVVRATARDGSRSVDSAARSVQGPREPMCGKYLCLGSGRIVELTPAARSTDFGQAGTGAGFLVIAVLVQVLGRRGRPEESTEDGVR